MKASKFSTVGDVEIPPLQEIQSHTDREFLRLPPVGQRCPVTGLSRAALNAWILPTEANGHKPPVKSFVIRQPGARTGIRLISYPHLREFIMSHAGGTSNTTENGADREFSKAPTGAEGACSNEQSRRGGAV
jgi:hypothetical protein